ncbi:hypothetical protein MMC07_008932 [Pseudocyphellaria aurata]|nr:hypothetical protein [Pseudocyphellaria aurata]
MSMSLAAFPPEILIGVMANVDSKPTLCNLSRCSRQLYLSTVPHLYRHITLREEIRHGEQPARQLRQIASVLMQRPELARLVRNFTLRVVGPDKSVELPSSDESVYPHSVPVDETLETAINAWGLSTESKTEWRRILSRAHLVHLDLVLALLLPGLPKLERLVLNLETNYDTRFFKEMADRVLRREEPSDTQTPLETLTSFVNKSAYLKPFSFDYMALLLRLFACNETGGPIGSFLRDSLRKELGELDDSSSPLIRLDLTGFYSLDTPDLCHILRAPRALKSFLYNTYPLGRNHFTDVRDALEPQKHCLESLSLDRGWSELDRVRIRGYQEPMTSFISFNSLKVFKTSVMFLEETCNGHGRDRLINIFPPSLETLHLTHFEDFFIDIGEALEYLLAQKSPRQIPRLKKLVLDEVKCWKIEGPRTFDDVPFPGRDESRHRTLSRLAAAQAVSLEVTRHSVEPRWLEKGWGLTLNSRYALTIEVCSLRK